MEKETDIHWIGWVIALLPYEIGLLFMLFGSATLIQVVFRHIFVPCHPWCHCFLPQS